VKHQHLLKKLVMAYFKILTQSLNGGSEGSKEKTDMVDGVQTDIQTHNLQNTKQGC
jgi:hypothetical protein